MDHLPVCRVGKIHRTGRTTCKTVMAHLARTRPTGNADPKRTKDNVWLVGDAESDLRAEIDAVFKKLGIKPRRNAVLANDIVLTISPAWFIKRGTQERPVWDCRKIETFKRISLTFAKKRFGSRVRRAVLHLDENTPHLQVIIVPIFAPKKAGERYRLSSRDMFSPESLSDLQQAWEDALQGYGVGRRTVRSATRHCDAKHYGGTIDRIEMVDPRRQASIELPKPHLLESAKAYHSRLAEWRQAEEVRTSESLEPLVALAVKGQLSAKTERDKDELRRRLRTAKSHADKLERKIRALQAKLANYAPLSHDALAQVLGTATIDPSSGPIDAVMQHLKLNRQAAMLFLAQKVSPEIAANAARDDIAAALRNACSIVALPAADKVGPTSSIGAGPVV